uniref:DCE1 decarboxylase n=1 Tax=Sinocyclocheilus grahami TaxID=75366 RepID=A0A672T6I0_SINGR
RLLSKTLKREKDLSFTSISTKVLDFHHPHQLLEGMEGFNLELCDQPESLEQILVDCRDTLKYGVRTGHPRFFNQLSSGLDIIGLAGEWLTSTYYLKELFLPDLTGNTQFCWYKLMYSQIRIYSDTFNISRIITVYSL